MFVILLHYIKSLAIIEAHLNEHRDFLDRHYAAGHLLASGPQVPRTGGVILAEGLNRKELDNILAEDPFQREQIATYQIIEFNPTKFGIGVEALFTTRSG